MMQSIFPRLLTSPPAEYSIYLDQERCSESTTSYSQLSSASWVPSSILKVNETDETTHKAYHRKTEQMFVNLRQQPTNLMLQEFIKHGQLHMDVRMQLLGQQLLMVYKTGHKYVAEKSRWRICHRSPPRQEGEPTSYFQAAHCNLFPELAMEASQGQAIPFSKKSWLCTTWNITTLLPTEWNQTDTAIDGKNSNSSSFRCHITSSILNEAAKRTATSCSTYYNEIIKEMAKRLDICLREYGSQHAYTLPLRCYRQVVQEYLDQANTGVNMLAWVCMEQSLETPEEIHAVQQRIWEMSKIQTVIFRGDGRFAGHKNQYVSIQPHQNLRITPMPSLSGFLEEQKTEEAHAPGVVTRAAYNHALEQAVGVAQAVLPPVVQAPVPQQEVYYREEVDLYPVGKKYRDYCLQDQEIQAIAGRHWQGGGHSTAQFNPMKKQIKKLITEGYGVVYVKNQDDIATCLFARLYVAV